MMIILVLTYLLHVALAQIPTTPPFTCVPIGTCPTPTNNTNIIDPRIVVPGQTTLCPPGQEACFGTTAQQCGRRYVTGATTANGPTTFGAHPWLAYISNQTGYTGVGVLINANTVLTAAHKVNLNVATPANIRISIGVWNPNVLGTTQNTTAAAIRIHERFDPVTLINDIAVIRLATPITLGFQSNIGTACLPPAGSAYTGRNCTVAGWGQTAFAALDAPTAVQRQVTVPIVDYATCRASMARADLLGAFVDRYLDATGGEICAGGQAQLDACTQDGGSPLVCPDPITGQFYIAGLVIWGKRCGMPGVYGVYVSVPYYRSWIDTQIASLG